MHHLLLHYLPTTAQSMLNARMSCYRAFLGGHDLGTHKVIVVSLHVRLMLDSTCLFIVNGSCFDGS